MKFLQFDVTPQSNLFNTPEFWVFSVLGLIIWLAIIRQVFSIPTISKHLKAQTFLQAAIAKKAGVSQEIIEKICKPISEDLSLLNDNQKND